MADYLDNMALFVDVVKANSFRRAAALLGMPNSTISRRVAQLEKTIGLRLLHRTTRRLELTEAGQLYYERSRRIVEEARQAHEALGDLATRPSGVLRISMPVDFATTYLAPLMPDFMALYPGIAFDLDLTPRNVDLVAEPFDLAIRIGMPATPNLVTRVIARVTPRLYASPAYLEKHGTPAHPAALAEHHCLAVTPQNRWTLHKGGETVEHLVTGRCRANSVAMMRTLATLDAGIVYLPERIVAGDLATGRLQPVLPDWHGAQGLVFAVTETRLLPAKTQRFIEFLQERLKDA